MVSLFCCIFTSISCLVYFVDVKQTGQMIVSTLYFLLSESKIRILLGVEGGGGEVENTVKSKEKIQS